MASNVLYSDSRLPTRLFSFVLFASFVVKMAVRRRRDSLAE